MMISCLMVTKYDIGTFSKAIRSYVNQTWQEKELVVVFEKTQPYSSEKTKIANSIGAKIILAEEGLKIGDLRNIAMDNATGDIVLQWDDDEINHPSRIKIQAEKLLSEDAYACFLEDRVHHYQKEKSLYIENGAYSFCLNGHIKQHCPGTLMMLNNKEFRYSSRNWGDDIEIMKNIAKQKKITTVKSMACLYVYSYHGENTTSYQSHKTLTAKTCYGHQQILDMESDIRRNLKVLGVGEGCAVMSVDGPVFLI